MKKLSLFILLVPFLAFSQAPIFKAEYVKTGLSKSEFISWAKSIKQWHTTNITETGDSLKAGYAFSYKLYQDEGTYNYVFKDNKVIQVRIDPKVDNTKIKPWVSKSHSFVKSEVEGQVYREFYENKELGYSVVLRSRDYKDEDNPGFLNIICLPLAQNL